MVLEKELEAILRPAGSERGREGGMGERGKERRGKDRRGRERRRGERREERRGVGREGGREGETWLLVDF